MRRLPSLLLAFALSTLLAAPAWGHGPTTAGSSLDNGLLGGPLLPAAQPELTSLKCKDGMAGPFPCENVDLESFLPLPLLGAGNGNDIWGWTDPQTGREYAIMGTSTTTAFVDVTKPTKPSVVGYLPFEGIPDFLLWRDIKVDGEYAFIVSELSGSGLQVFDLKRLRDAGSLPRLFTADATYDKFSAAHNIAINEETNFAYVAGSDTCLAEGESGGLHMVDISDPLQPRFAGCALVPVDNDPDTPPDNYVHDAQCVVYRGPDADYQGREICLGSNEDVVAIYDVTDKSDPVVISTTGYPSAAYTHQGWLTEDQGHFLFGDELDEQERTVEKTTTYVMDVSDLDNPGAPKPFAHQTSSADHNLYTLGNRVYESNYMAGLRILAFDDASLAAGQLDEVAFFDVVPVLDLPQFAGTWSNYPYFDSGTVVVSTIEEATHGLLVLRPRLPASDGD